MSSPYAWRIDQDHLDTGPSSCVGEVGPRGARTDSENNPSGYAHNHQFRMYDDDGILYLTGTLYWDGYPEPEEQYAYGPLGDFGMAALGCTSVRYTGRPDWDCE